MDRLGAIDPKSLTGEAKRLYDDIVGYFGHKNPYYTTELDNGQPIGPFAIELHTPGAGYAWLHMTQSLSAIPSLPPLAREIAILATGTSERAAYEVYAHTGVSGLFPTDVDSIAAGQCPAHLDEKCQTTFRIAKALNSPGVLEERFWEEGLRVLGREATIAVVHYVGFYKYIATILNGFDAKVPER